jgi:transglutaminase-like putative cysteine protease
MRFVSPEGRLGIPGEEFPDDVGIGGKIWRRVRDSVGAGRFWSAVLVILLTLAIARSTATVHWVDGVAVVTPIALLGAIFMGALALSPVTDPIALGAGFILAPVAAAVGAWPQLHLHHPTDVVGPQLVSTWLERISDGTAAQDPAFFLFLICLLMWVTGAWLSWCVLRWRKPMLGLIPGAAAFATNVLNVPLDQNGYVLAMIVLTLALLLWTNYTSSVASATRASVKLTGDARWDFWESGLVAMAGLVVLGILLPPLSTADRTLDVETGVFSNWAQLQSRLSHPGIFAGTAPSTGVTGFTTDVKLSGSLQRTRDPVFEYTIVGDYSGPRYFRGVNETETVNGEWRWPNPQGGVAQIVGKDGTYQFAEDYQDLAVAGIQVRMLHPPSGSQSTLFYPGTLVKVDRVTMGMQVPLNAGDPTQFYSMDRLTSVQPSSSSGLYNGTVEYPTATVAQLQGAGSQYPDWVNQYMSLPNTGYRPPQVLEKIHALALSIVQSAGAKTPYDAATAIEQYLRDSRNFTYSLDAKTPAGRDPIDYFLFESHVGYCEFFATAMGDMLRSLGIPTRLVNGFGPGAYDSTVQAFVVRSDDAHTWVEVYFPQYGWIPFEPTADTQGTYTTIQRGVSGTGVCLRDAGCDGSGLTGGGGGGIATPPDSLGRGHLDDPGSAVGGGGIRIGALDQTWLTRIGAIFVAILLLLLVLASRYLRPRTVASVWKRTLALASLAGAKRRPGETPLELGRRLQRTFPEAADPVGNLTSAFAVAAYAPPEVAATSRASIMEAWSALRPMLLRRVLARLRPTRP